MGCLFHQDCYTRRQLRERLKREGIRHEMTMKIGVLSDTHLHGVTPSLRRILHEHLAGLDVLFHAGDVVSADVVRFLDQEVFYGVSGNMDPPEVREMLPPFRLLELDGWRIGLTHGGGGVADLEERVAGLFPDADVIVYGHSHIPANHVRSGVLFFNPGTATGYSREGRHTVGVLELGETVEGHIVEIGED